MRFRLIPAFAFAVAFPAVLPAQAPGTIRGTVTLEANNAPVHGATVMIVQ